MNFVDYWQYVDAVTKLLFFVLICLSLISWITGLIRLYASVQLQKSVSDYLKKQVSDKLEQLKLELTSTDEKKLVIEQTLLQAIARTRFASDKGMIVLGTTASIAPFIGLFGTVWGIFHALRSIGQSGQAGLAQVAEPVGEALIMTGLGLGVAIPAVIFYNLASRVNRGLIHQANDTAHELLATAVIKDDDMDSDADNDNK